MQWPFIFVYEKELLVKVEKVINVWGEMLIDKGPNICASGVRTLQKETGAFL